MLVFMLNVYRSILNTNLGEAHRFILCEKHQIQFNF